jgi:hypothetical protein
MSSFEDKATIVEHQCKNYAWKQTIEEVTISGQFAVFVLVDALSLRI